MKWILDLSGLNHGEAVIGVLKCGAIEFDMD